MLSREQRLDRAHLDRRARIRFEARLGRDDADRETVLVQGRARLIDELSAVREPDYARSFDDAAPHDLCADARLARSGREYEDDTARTRSHLVANGVDGLEL